MRRSAALLALLAVAAALPQPAVGDGGAAYPLPPGHEAVQRALGDVRTRLDAQGCVAYYPDFGCGHATTSWNLMAVVAAGGDPDAWRVAPGAPTPVDYLRAHGDALSADADCGPADDHCPAPTDAARAVLAILAAGEDPRSFGGQDYVARLLGFHEREAPDRFGDPLATHHAFWAAVALRGAGLPPDDAVLRDVEAQVRDAQRPDGGWSYKPTDPSDGDSTGAALMAMGALGADADDPAVARAVDYLSGTNQHASGGFRGRVGLVGDAPPDAQSTAYAVQGLLAVGADPRAPAFQKRDGDPVRFLLAMQADDGGFRKSPGSANTDGWATAQAIPALRGFAFPLLAPTAAITWTPARVTTARDVTFTAAAEDPDGGALTYAWRIDGAPAGNGAAVTHRFTERGPHNVSVTVTDDEGLVHTERAVVQVVNAAPVAKLSASPGKAHRGRAVELSALGSADPDGAVAAYRFTFGDGNATGWRPDPVARHRYGALGAFNATVEVRDGGGATATARATVTVVNLPPTVRLPENVTATRAAPANLTAEAADADGAVVAWAWRLGDGNASAAAVAPNHTYSRLGQFNVTLTVTDTDGATANATATVTVMNLPPALANVTAEPVVAAPGEPVRFRAEATDADGPAPRVAWAFGDGAALEGATVERAFRANGTHNVTVTAQDANGATATARVTVRVVDAAVDAAPVVARLTHAPDPPRAGKPVRLVAEAADDGAVDRVVFRWRAGDGAGGKLVDDEAPFEALAGPFPKGARVTYNATVVDDAGQSSAPATGAFELPGNRPPEAVLAVAPGAPLSLENVTLDAAASRDPDGGALQYRFRFGDGHATPWQDAPAARHAYGAPGSYRAVVEVRDGDGATAATEATVAVANRPPRVTIVAPGADAAPAAGRLAVAGEAVDPDGAVAEVRVWLGENVTAEGAAAWRAAVDLTGLAPGAHQLHARARDAAGAWSAVATRVVTVAADAAGAVENGTGLSRHSGADPAAGAARAVPGAGAVVAALTLALAALAAGRRQGGPPGRRRGARDPWPRRRGRR